MSETERAKGKLKKVISDLPLIELCTKLLFEEGCTNFDPKDIHDVNEKFNEIFWRGKYIVIDKEVYELEMESETDACEDIYEASYDKDGNIDFLVQFYNGGCCYSEAIEDAVKLLKKKPLPVVREFASKEFSGEMIHEIEEWVVGAMNDARVLSYDKYGILKGDLKVILEYYPEE